MSQQTAPRFEHSALPSGIKPTPRNSDHGEVLDEVGVLQRAGRVRYWKVIQLLRKDNGELEGRYGYYKKIGQGDWFWSRKPLMLKLEEMNKLTARATTEGILSQ